MRNQLLRLSLLALLSLHLPGSVNANPDEIAEALAAVGAGSVSELKSRLFTNSLTVFDEAFRAQAIAALRAERLTQGKLLRRVAPVFQRVLQLHERGGKVELFLFHHDAPLAHLWRGCVLMLSDGLAATLDDGALAGIIAHELGHSYFEDEMAAAQRNQDARALGIIELKCDAVALLSLKLLGCNPALYLPGLKRIQELNRRQSRSSGIFQSHPELVARAQFAQRFIKALD
jgi:Zn-dependent protease with chaperone function